MIEVRIRIYPMSERYPELGRLVYAKYDDGAGRGNWFPVRLFYDAKESPPYYWQDLTEPEGNDEVVFGKFTHWMELPTEI